MSLHFSEELYSPVTSESKHVYQVCRSQLKPFLSEHGNTRRQTNKVTDTTDRPTYASASAGVSNKMSKPACKVMHIIIDARLHITLD